MAEETVSIITKLPDGRAMLERVTRDEANMSPVARIVSQLLRKAAIPSICQAVTEYVQRELQTRDKKIERLETTIAELKARPTLKYMGVHEKAREYSPGEFVTWDGALWHCNVRTHDRPGISTDWVLAVKRGKDAKEVADR